MDGDREFIMSNKGGIVNEHPLELTKEDLDYIRTFKLIHTSCNGHLDGELHKLREAGVPISYDMSGRWNQEYYIETIGPQVDIAFASCGDTSEEEIKSSVRL